VRIIWKIVKLIGFLFLSIIVLVAGWMLYRAFVPARLYLSLGDRENPTRIEIPYDIVKKEDCVAYQEWVHNNFTPILVPSDRCPWQKKPTSNVAHFVWPHLKLQFHVPRAYLWQNSWEPDGIKTDIHIMFRYPDMEPPTEEDYNKNNTIRVTFSPNKSEAFCEEKPRYCGDLQLMWWDTCIRSLEGELFSFKKVKHLSDENLDEIEIILDENKTRKYRFIRGAYESPELWYLCTPKADNPGCEGGWNYNENIYVDFYFGMKFLHDHDQVRQRIFAKIKEWNKPWEGENTLRQSLSKRDKKS
jgi:hypothetical protein